MALARACHRHWHAVQRDILQLGFRKTDIFTTLTVDEMVSIVVAAQPGTAVHHAVNGGFTTTDHLLATAMERDAGLVDISQRFVRPGVTDTRPMKPPKVNFQDPSRPVQNLGFDVFDSIEEFEARRRAHIKGAA